MKEHDFKKFPELANSQMGELYFQSPHKQIVEDFSARVVSVKDGDTIKVKADFRDFIFPIRLWAIDAPELDSEGGFKSRDWLANRILGKNVEIKVDPINRVEKWGRLLGDVIFQGISMSEESVAMGHSVPFEQRSELVAIPDLNHELDIKLKEFER